jgi:hypothetical protein
MTSSYLRETKSDLREINEVRKVQQLTNDELDVVSGGDDPDAGGQLRRLSNLRAR